MFEQIENIIEGADENKLLKLLNKLEVATKLSADEVARLKSLVEVRRQILWFDELPDTGTSTEPTIYTHWSDNVPKQFRKPLSICIKSDCKYCKQHGKGTKKEDDSGLGNSGDNTREEIL